MIIVHKEKNIIARRNFYVYFGALLYLAVHNLWSSEGLNVFAKFCVLSISQLNDFLGSGALL